ncbi:MAG: VWA domain-containing protein [SAR324 cluster bacterium]|nr:VWA domain-containing protein [SAR324 cluster bacterium]
MLTFLFLTVTIILIVSCNTATDAPEPLQQEVIRQETVQAAPQSMKMAIMGKHISQVRSFPGSEVPRLPASHSQFNTEEYQKMEENPFLEAATNPLSTFSIDVDTASYSNARRFINRGQFPPKDAIRIEEFINYFTYQYQIPVDKHPFSIYTELSTAPWNSANQLIHIGLQGKTIPKKELPPSNLVFLLDVSGSMHSPHKLPLLKAAFKLLLQQLSEKDRVSLIVYAGAAGVVLPSTPASKKETILASLEKLRAGGSTAGGAGIQLAYQIAKQNFLPAGNNRIVLATDGDFNVGVSSTGALVRLVEEQRKSGIFLTVLGFGMGNYKDDRMEQLADKGNGNYAYIDNLLEAQKVLVKEMGGTFFTIAKDVKIQVEFNPAKVKAYRLIGYENRMLRKEDFNDDTKDAGEIGAGHSVTALYEVIPASTKADLPQTDPLKYQEAKVKSEAYQSDEIMTVKFRYKAPDGQKSQLITRPLLDKKQALENTTNDFRFSAAVAQYGLLMKNSKYKGDTSFDNILNLAKHAKGPDMEGYRAEFIKLVEMTKLLKATE